MDLFATPWFSEQLQRPIGNHFISIHVGGRSRAGLKDVDDKLFVVLFFHDLLRRPLDRTGNGFIQQPQIFVGPGGSMFD
jgi:hypothetical protein